ncbi:DoxX family membrane protein [Oculatella sp. LEGE 06141]|uniref:DoxX family protein n=1 Tax=Oculatella sp. LEGE 06141 TaxID=1828648 RepID=UPI001880CA11|nr:DoxX family membrane protein [Oculatella sp. LEGE 06141]MBE9179707.1 DoxX family membrane protein [Oculatella sp. LEGE 06141]
MLQKFTSKQNKERLRVVLAIAIIVVGITHFVVPEPYTKIVPSALPAPEFLVYLSGFFEILGGIGLMIPPTSQAAAWGLILLYIAVFPANINMAVNRIHIIDGVPDTSPWVQAIRLPLQGVLIAWAYWYTKLTTDYPQASIVPYSWLAKLFPHEPGSEAWMKQSESAIAKEDS